MDKEAEQKMLEYIVALEKTNVELVKTLKYCVEVLIQFKDILCDPKGWQVMLDQADLVT